MKFYLLICICFVISPSFALGTASPKMLSPFEVKDRLIELSKESCEIKNKQGKACRVLNAGRGNPNFLNISIREAMVTLMAFGNEIAGKALSNSSLGLRPHKSEIAKKLDQYLESHKSKGAKFLKSAIEYAITSNEFIPDEFVYELVDNALGDFYPTPPRVSLLSEKILIDYIGQVVLQDRRMTSSDYNVFATEGATSAMVYLFKSLKENKLLQKGDKVAIITPIFSPYLEIPHLNDYKLVPIFIEGNEDLGWKIPTGEISKLKDKTIKVLFHVNPTNPSSIGVSSDSINEIADIVKTDNPNLIVVSDIVYATFIDDFHSLIEEIPFNTVVVYSFSKYYGVTGWRLGFIMLNKRNILDKLVQALPEKDNLALDHRYSLVSENPRDIKFIDRLEIDSRDVALAHTGGLSGPQQAIMTLGAIYGLIDKEKYHYQYREEVQSILYQRIELLYKGLGEVYQPSKNKTNYYALINIMKIANSKYGKEFSEALKNKITPMDFLLRLAKDHATVCLPGSGFAGPDWTIRVSLGNLDTDDYMAIGKNITRVIQSYHDE